MGNLSHGVQSDSCIRNYVLGHFLYWDTLIPVQIFSTNMVHSQSSGTCTTLKYMRKIRKKGFKIVKLVIISL